MDKQFACKICNTPVNIKNGKIYMRCMCDEEIRIIPYLKDSFTPDNVYLLETKGLNLCQDGNLMTNPTSL
jgi:hypothetical protein